MKSIRLYTVMKELFASALFNKKMKKMEAFEDWESLYNEMSDQTVQFIPGNLIQKINMSPELKDIWKKEIIRQVYTFENYLYNQEILLTELRKKQICCVVLKGASSASYYPFPEYRIMGDIDIMIREDQFEVACKCLRECGYMQGHIGEHHINFYKNRVTVEVHNKTTLEKTQVHNREDWEKLIQEGFDNLMEKEIFNYQFPVFPRLQEGMILLNHMVHHMQASLGLRQILDWMMYVYQCVDETFWREELQPIAKHFGLEKFAVTITRMCQIYLGLPEDGISWCKNADEKICAVLMNKIENSGNMGNKMDRTNAVENEIVNKKSFFRLIKNMNKNGASKWKLAQKYSVFTHIAWIYQLIYWMKQWKKYNVSFKSIRDRRKQEKMIQKLFD